MKTSLILLISALSLITNSPLIANELSSNPIDPANLYIGWWSNFKNEDENKGNFEKLIEELETLKSQLDPSKHPLTIVQIDQVILSAEQVQNERSEVIKYKQMHPLYLSKYTISELLKVSNNIQELEDQKSISTSRIENIKQNTDRLTNEIDYLQLEYPLKQGESVEKLTLGLQIMNLRFMIEIDELKIKRLQKLSNLQEDNLLKLQKELNIAEERMDFSDLDKDAIEKQINATQSLLVKANQQLLKSRKESETENLDELSASIHVLQIKAEILFEKIKLLIFELDHERSKEDIREEFVDFTYKLELFFDSTNQIGRTLQDSQTFDYIDLNDTKMNLNALQNKLSNIQLLTSLLKEKVVEKKTSFGDRLQSMYYTLSDLSNDLLGYTTIKLFRLNDYSVTIWVLLRAIAIFVGAIILSRFSLRFIKNFDRLKFKIGSANTYILARIFYYLSVILGLFIALYSIGFGMSNFVIIAGALGVGVGLGLQAIANNFFSGLVVLFSKILKVGDVIETDDGFIGVVRAIKMQNIQIRTLEGKDIILPNADLVTKNLTNWTMVDPFIRLNIPFGVEYGADRDLVDKIVIDIANKFEYTIKNESVCPNPKVWLVNLGDNALNLELVVWVNIKKHSSTGSMKTEYLWEIERELIKHGIDIPFPQTDIRLIEAPEINLRNT